MNLKFLFFKNLLIFRRNVYPILFIVVFLLLIIPVLASYNNINNWKIKTGIVNEDDGYHGVRYSVYIISELHLNIRHFDNSTEAYRAARSGEVDAVIVIYHNFSKVIHDLSRGNISSLRNATLLSINIFSEYPQVESSLASKIENLIKEFIYDYNMNATQFQEANSSRLFFYYSAILLLSSVTSFYYSLLFVITDKNGPFYWEFFSTGRNFVLLLFSYFLFFLLFNMISSVIVGWVMDISTKTILLTVIPVSIVTFGAMSLALFTSIFVRREKEIYYVTPLAITIFFVGSGVLGPYSYIHDAVKIIYLITPLNVNLFYYYLLSYIRVLLISVLLFGIGIIHHTLRIWRKGSY